MSSAPEATVETLVVHEASYSPEELLLGPDLAEDFGLSTGDFVEIRATTVSQPSQQSLVLRAVTRPAAGGRAPGVSKGATSSSGKYSKWSLCRTCSSHQ